MPDKADEDIQVGSSQLNTPNLDRNPFEKYGDSPTGNINSLTNQPVGQPVGQSVEAEEDISQNPFSKYGDQPTEETQRPSLIGSIAGSFAENILPSAAGMASLAASGYGGAKLGGLAGVALPQIFGLGPANPIADIGSGTLGAVGAIGGGIVGMIGGQQLVSGIQNWAISKLPESWQETLGQTERQKEERELEHPMGTWLGAMAPYIMTMSPVGAAEKIAVESTTTLGKIMANPLASRAISGTVMGGFEAGNEVWNGDSLDWQKIGIATGLGFIFNKSNQIGEKLTSIGTLAAEMTPGMKFLEDQTERYRQNYIRSKFEQENPITISQANSLNVIGPGVTQEVFAGQEQRNPIAAQAALKEARVEQQILGTNQIIPNIHEVAKNLNPELIEKYEDLNNQKDILSNWVNEHEHESDESRWAQSQLEKVNQQLGDIEKDRIDLYKRASDSIGYDQTSILPKETQLAEKSPEIMEKLSPQSRPLEIQRQVISNEITQNLVSAKEPKDRAEDIARLATSYYETLAANFNGELGTAEDLYKKYFPNVRKEGIVENNKADFGDYNKMSSNDIWQNLINNKTEQLEKITPTSGVNTEFTRTGQPVRGKSFQNLQQGNIIDVGFAKNLLISSIDENGIFTLLKKPDKNGMSQSYTFKPHEGLMKDEIVNFKDSTKHLFKNENLVDNNLEQRSSNKIPNGYIENLFDPDKSAIVLTQKSNASTFIHEMAHQWLVDFFEFAQHPLAPDNLKKDFFTTLDYLNVKNPEEMTKPTDLKRWQHEKWSRGFEQYMREGVAPSPQLADVFSRFKDWLTSVYQTLKNLGKPISSDIKSVFDRMLTQEPEKTVIIPDVSKGPTLSDIHETDALHAIPHPEAPEADRIHEEASRFFSDQPFEVKNELEKSINKILASNESKGETTTIEKRASEMESSSEGFRSISKSDISGTSNGSINAGGGTNKAESSGRFPSGTARGSENSGRAGISDLSPVARERRAPAPTPYVRRAANIHLDNLTDVEKIKETLEQLAEQNDDFKNFRIKTPLTEGDVLKFGEDVGFNQKQMQNLFHMSRIVSENVDAARQMMISSLEKYLDARDKWTQTQDPADALSYWEARQQADLISGYFSGYEANAGRGLGNFRRSKLLSSNRDDVNDLLKKTAGMTLFQLEQEIERSKSIDSVQGASSFLRNEIHGKVGDKIHEAYINFLISNPITHKAYAIGNMILSMYRNLLVTPTAAGIGNIASALGREGERVRLGEMKAFPRELFNPIPFVAAKEAFKAGAPVRLPGEDIKETQSGNVVSSSPGIDFVERPQVNINAKFSDLLPDFVGMLHGIQDTFLSMYDLIKNGRIDKNSPLFTFKRSNLGSIPDINIGGKLTVPVGSAIRAPSERMVTPIHSFFSVLNYNIERTKWAYRTAANEGLHGEAYSQRVAELSQNPPIEKMKEFGKSAYSDVLMGEPGKVAKATSKVLDLEIGDTGIRPLRFVIPFNRIQGELAKKSFTENGILAFASKSARNDLLGKNGNIAQDMQIAKILAGSALTTLGLWWASRHILNGDGPTDPANRLNWLNDGNMPHSIQIGNFQYDIGKLGAIGKLLSASADLWGISHGLSEDGLHAAFNHLAHAASRLFLDESPFGAMSNLAKAIDDPGKYGINYASSLISNFVPYSSFLRQISRYEDPYMKDAHGFIQNLEKGIPFLTENVPNKLDTWGDPILDVDDPHYLIGLGIRRSQISQDPVRNYLDGSGFSIGKVQKQINNHPLTDDQYREYSQLSGRTAHIQLLKIMQSGAWGKASAEDRHDLIVETVKQARNAAANQLIRKYPILAEYAAKARRWLVHSDK